MTDDTAASAGATARLIELGFSSYEARTYVGLLGTGPATGYAVAGATGVPQPKVYETLRRLKERDAVVQLPGHPARWSATPPDTLLERLEESFTGRIGAARSELADLAGPGSDAEPQLVWRHRTLDAVVGAAREMLCAASTHVYLSGTAEALGELADGIAEGDARGVEFSILHFGDLPFPAPRGRAFRHSTTDAVLRPSHRARHLAVVVDSRSALWAVARDGRMWQGVSADDPLLASIVKGWVRHDVFVQRMYAALPAELEARFGPGLLQLADLATEDPADTHRADAAGEPDALDAEVRGA
jgi:sugar-specific transcriptional regulator TrmB